MTAHTASNREGIITVNESERLWKEAILAY
jgi:hypothetical protein